MRLVFFCVGYDFSQVLVHILHFFADFVNLARDMYNRQDKDNLYKTDKKNNYHCCIHFFTTFQRMPYNAPQCAVRRFYFYRIILPLDLQTLDFGCFCLSLWANIPYFTLYAINLESSDFKTNCYKKLHSLNFFQRSELIVKIRTIDML